MELPKIHRAVRDAWADWLEDPSHQQTYSYLHYTDHLLGERFCCLGGLCQVAIAAGIPLEVGRESHDHDVVTYDERSGQLPMRVVEWAFGPGNDYRAEWTGNEPVYDGDPILALSTDSGYEYRRATVLNDMDGWTFPRIAAAVRALPTLEDDE